MTKSEVLEILSKLEDFRIKMERGEIHPGSEDWVVRMCEAIIAKDHFSQRSEWTTILNKYAR